MAMYYAVQMQGDKPVLMSQFNDYKSCEDAVRTANRNYKMLGVDFEPLKICAIMDVKPLKPGPKAKYTEEEFLNVYHKYMALELSSDEAAEELGLKSGESFTHIIKKHGIPTKMDIEYTGQRNVSVIRKEEFDKFYPKYIDREITLVKFAELLNVKCVNSIYQYIKKNHLLTLKEYDEGKRPYTKNELKRCWNLYENWHYELEDVYKNLRTTKWILLKDARLYGLFEKSVTDNRWMRDMLTVYYPLYIGSRNSTHWLANKCGVSEKFLLAYMDENGYKLNSSRIPA